ncbi:MAG: hypothetical protein KC549_06435 [Myxococcales bacterium]|nr:hypothetical protein [Myxococcales bacterium]MCB9546726.1 hypothetical protein [Myxococcales bacterium]
MTLQEALLYPLPGGFVAWQAAAALVVLLGGYGLAKRLLRQPERQHPFMGARTCGGCGWRGNVSRFNDVCPRCGRNFT